MVVYQENIYCAIANIDLNYLCQNKTFLIVTEEFLKKALYEVLYNNLLLPRTHEIDREEESEAFDGSTDSLVKLYRENQITFEEFTKLSEAEIERIINISKDFYISKERFFQLVPEWVRARKRSENGGDNEFAVNNN